MLMANSLETDMFHKWWYLIFFSHIDPKNQQNKREEIQSWYNSGWVSRCNFILSGINDKVHVYWPKGGSYYILISQRAELWETRHTFLNVDTALVKTCHSLVATEQERQLPSQVKCSEMLLFDSFSIAEKNQLVFPVNGNEFHTLASLPFFPFHSMEFQWGKWTNLKGIWRPRSYLNESLLFSGISQKISEIWQYVPKSWQKLAGVKQQWFSLRKHMLSILLFPHPSCFYFY